MIAGRNFFVGASHRTDTNNRGATSCRHSHEGLCVPR